MRSMADDKWNRVRDVREELGLSQIALAARAKTTRQSISAIEAGRVRPAIDAALRIASALDSQVEDLFGVSKEPGVISAEPSSTKMTGRVALAHIAGRWVSYPLTQDGSRISADGVVTHASRGRVEVEPTRLLSDARENVILMGCATGLGLLADRLNSRSRRGRFVWLPRSSTAALEALAKEQAHVAGVHLVDARTGEANVADVRRHARGLSVA